MEGPRVQVKAELHRHDCQEKIDAPFFHTPDTGDRSKQHNGEQGMRCGIQKSIGGVYSRERIHDIEQTQNQDQRTEYGHRHWPVNGASRHN